MDNFYQFMKMHSIERRGIVTYKKAQFSSVSLAPSHKTTKVEFAAHEKKSL